MDDLARLSKEQKRVLTMLERGEHPMADIFTGTAKRGRGTVLANLRRLGFAYRSRRGVGPTKISAAGRRALAGAKP